MNDEIEHVDATDPDDQSNSYRPVFDAAVRTGVYVTCALLGVILSVAAPVAIAAHAPEWATILLSALAGAIPTVAAAFGVAYNPSRVDSN